MIKTGRESETFHRYRIGKKKETIEFDQMIYFI